MKKRIFLITLMAAIFVCIFAISANAAQIAGYQQFEVELLDGSVITVYESANWDQWQGRLNLTDNTYTEPPLDTEKTYPLLDWSQVVTVDFTNGHRKQLNTTTGEYEIKYGTNNGYSMHLTSTSFTKANATNLKTIKTGNATLVSGGKFGAFPALEEIICGEKLKEIGWNAFDYNTKLTKIDFSACTNFTSFGQQAFIGCTSLVTVTLPNTVTNLSNNVFKNCTSLKTVVLSTSLTTVDSSTFIGCTNLETVSFVGTPSETLMSATSTAAPNATIATLTACEAYGHTNVVSLNDCVEQCGICQEIVNKEKPIHNNISVITYTTGYASKGAITHSCQNEGCTYSETAEVPALFTCQGYSAPEDGRGGIVIGYTVNNEAIKEYTETTGKTLKYGVFAAAKEKLGDSDIFGSDGTVANNVINAEISNYSFVAFELKIIGFTDEYKETKLAMGAYVAVTDKETNTTEYSYMQSGTPAENEKYCFISYNDVVNSK